MQLLTEILSNHKNLGENKMLFYEEIKYCPQIKNGQIMKKCISSLLTRGTQIKRTMMLLNIRQIGKILRSLTRSRAGEDVKSLEFLIIYNCFKNQVSSIFQVKDAPIPSQIFNRKQKNVHSSIIHKSKVRSTQMCNNRMGNLWYSHTMKYYTATERNKCGPNHQYGQISYNVK